ncbi:MAG: hypothetical protein PHS41_08215 [Victivallaceae bacterium]|nr:hypothetical protein [Victivallaceae bacterium]
MTALSERVIETRFPAEAAGRTLLEYLSGRFTYHDTAGWMQRFRNGELSLNGQAALPEDCPAPGSVIRFTPSSLEEPACDLRYDTVYEDDDVIVVNKPGNLVTHPAGIFYFHTLWYLLME